MKTAEQITEARRAAAVKAAATRKANKEAAIEAAQAADRAAIREIHKARVEKIHARQAWIIARETEAFDAQEAAAIAQEQEQDTNEEETTKQEENTMTEKELQIAVDAALKAAGLRKDLHKTHSSLSFRRLVTDNVWLNDIVSHGGRKVRIIHIDPPEFLTETQARMSIPRATGPCQAVCCYYMNAPRDAEITPTHDGPMVK
jgi:hypothetical protein